MSISYLRNFINLEASSGIVLLIAAFIAMILANSPWSSVYNHILTHPWFFSFSLLNIINEVLMSFFFLVVSLEIKRELLIGELNSISRAALPMIAALGGMIVPALIYLICNIHAAPNVRGWAIPTATDIAFSLGVLTLLGSKAPRPLKIFLTALAIIDDLGAIIIIAIFYGHGLHLIFLLGTACCFLVLIIINFLNIRSLLLYALLGILLWVFILKSGIHVTIAGVLLGLFIPLQNPPHPSSLLLNLEQRLHPWVAFGILPLFALANAGVSVSGITLNLLHHPIFLGIVLGLFIGKQTGVFAATWLAIKCGIAQLPTNITWQQLYGLATLCGIGFTMSLFIGLLAFPQDANTLAIVKLGILFGSILSGIVGYFIILKNHSCG